MQIFFQFNGKTFRLKNEQQNAVRLREKLKNLFQGDETELKMEIDRFKGDYSTKQQQLAERTNKKKTGKQHIEPHYKPNGRNRS